MFSNVFIDDYWLIVNVFVQNEMHCFTRDVQISGYIFCISIRVSNVHKNTNTKGIKPMSLTFLKNNEKRSILLFGSRRPSININKCICTLSLLIFLYFV